MYSSVPTENEASANGEAMVSDNHSSVQEPAKKLVPLTIINGRLKKSDQLSEYTDRGIALHHMNFLDFTLQTYDQAIPADLTKAKSPRTAYDKGTGRDDRCRVTRIKTESVDILPNIIGGWFPRGDRENLRELYCACILTFLKPWKCPQDIVANFPSFQASYQSFLDVNPALHDFIDNIDFYHVAHDAAKKTKKGFTPIDDVSDDLLASIDGPSMVHSDDADEMEITEIDIDYARLMRTSTAEMHFGLTIVAEAEKLGIFQEDENLLAVEFKPIAHVASDAEAQHYDDLFQSLKGLIDNHDYTPQNECSIDKGGLQVACTDNSLTSHASRDDGVLILESSSGSTVRPLVNSLKDRQAFAHRIIEEHLQNHRDARNPEQLLMMVMGPGGTGKTVFIKALKETFDYYDMPIHVLVTTATSGIAASLTGGCTLHTWAGLSRRSNKQKTTAKRSKKPTKCEKKRTENIGPAEYLIIDEVSMLPHYDFGQLSDICGIVKTQLGATNAHLPFGGINVILCGDFHQFPPVGDPMGALYKEPDEKACDIAKRGFELYRRFETVVLLKEQLRVTDALWMSMLQHLRDGACDADDIALVKDVILASPNCPPTDLHSSFWRGATLITSRNAARRAWNSKSIRKHAAASNNRVYRVFAEDTKGRLQETLTLKERLTVAQMPDKATAPLEDVLELAVGMKAMVTVNISPKDDLANGTRGTVENIILDPRESVQNLEIDDEGIITLAFPPTAILFRPDDAHTVPVFPGLPDGVLPITPCEQTFHANPKQGSSFQVNRRQLALTPAYAFTHYKGQGQTLCPVIIDIAHPPGNLGKIDNFSAYVALSRAKGRESVRLLRSFDESVMTMSPPLDLLLEDQRLERLDRATRKKYT